MLTPILLRRGLSTHTLRDKLTAIIPKRQEFVKSVRASYGGKKLGEVTVEMAYGGMRGVKGMIWEPSVLDSEEVNVPL